MFSLFPTGRAWGRRSNRRLGHEARRAERSDKRDYGEGKRRENEGITMGDGIQITHVAKRFSSHTLSHSRPDHKASRATTALRERLIAAMVEVVAEGGDPRLGRTRVLL
jgi:hypothetical protein